MNKIEVKVICTPARVDFECTECCCDNEINYSDFIYEHGESPYDWNNSELECKLCGAKHKIDGFDWY